MAREPPRSHSGHSGFPRRDSDRVPATERGAGLSRVYRRPQQPLRLGGGGGFAMRPAINPLKPSYIEARSPPSLGPAAPSALRSSGYPEPITTLAAIPRLIKLNSSFAITGGSSKSVRSKPCLVSRRGTNPRLIRICGAGGNLQFAKLRLTPTYWGLLRQSDKPESVSVY